MVEPSVRDERVEPTITRSDVIHAGRVFELVSEDVDLGEAGVVTREFLRHPGAVAVVAMDADDRVLLIRQYRHPVRAFCWEVPAGLRDVAGESLVDTARRELAEEADLTASTWHTLADYWTTPGASDEALRVFLARDLTPVPEADRHERTEEELGMPTAWVPLDEALALVTGGAVHNPSTVVGILAAHAARVTGWSALREADAQWCASSSSVS